MVIRGNIRGNGAQLAHYLMNEGGNDRIRILEVDGRPDASEGYLHQALQTMSLTAELTRTDKGLYHAQISPAYGEDKAMSGDDWLRAADILGHELGLGEQRRVIVLHTKKYRTHAHVVFERYDHQTGRVIDNRFSRLAQDRARKEMERVFNHQRTPHRNKHRPELKETLTKLWQETDTVHDFIRSVQDKGYLLAEGIPRHPFMVVDETGRSFDLVRQLQGVRLKEVRQRLRDVALIPEKQAIEEMRQRMEGKADGGGSPHRQRDADKATIRATEFWANKDGVTAEDLNDQKRQKQLRMAELFLQATPEITTSAQTNSPEKKKDTAPAEAASMEGREASERPKDQSGTETDREHKGHEDEKRQSRERLNDFMLSQEELVSAPKPLSNQQRQQRVTEQFFDNQDAVQAETDKDAELKRLMQEQKEVRERTRQRSRKRTR